MRKTSKRTNKTVEPHLTATGCHLPCGIRQCYLPPDTSEIPALTPVSQAGTWFVYPVRMEGWIVLGWPVTYRDGLPAHTQSPIQVLIQQRTVHGRESNSQPVDHESDALVPYPTWLFKKSFPDIIIWYWLQLDFYLRLVCSNFETVLLFKVYDTIWCDMIYYRPIIQRPFCRNFISRFFVEFMYYYYSSPYGRCFRFFSRSYCYTVYSAIDIFMSSVRPSVSLSVTLCIVGRCTGLKVVPACS